MRSLAPAPIPARRSAVWVLCLVCTYVLAGPWALTPELALHSLPRDVAVTAVPPKHLTASRALSSMRSGTPAREMGRWGHGPWPGADAEVEPALRRDARAGGAARSDVPSRQRGPRAVTNRAPYDATAPPSRH